MPSDGIGPDEPALNAALARASIFQDVGPGALAAAVTELEWISFPHRHTEFRESDADDRLYIITSGRVKDACAGRNSDILIAALGPSDVFGELALLGPGPRTSTVTNADRGHYPCGPDHHMTAFGLASVGRLHLA